MQQCKVMLFVFLLVLGMAPQCDAVPVLGFDLPREVWRNGISLLSLGLCLCCLGSSGWM